MAWNESNYLVNKIDQDPSAGPRTAKFLGITNGESDVKATADMGGQDVRQVLVLEAWALNKHLMETFKMSELLVLFMKRLDRNVPIGVSSVLFAYSLLVDHKEAISSPEGCRRSPLRSPNCSSKTSPSPPSSNS